MATGHVIAVLLRVLRVATAVVTVLLPVACVALPEAATRGVRPRRPEDLAHLSVEERQAHSLARACELDDVAACDRLAASYWVGHGVPRHRFHAMSLWEYACAHEIGSACEEAATVLLGEELGQPNPDRALDLLASGCSADRFSACTRAGKVTLTAAGGASPRKAARWFRRGCDGGDRDGCYQLALTMLDGHGTRDPERAITLLTEGCDGKHALSCRQMAAMHRDGAFMPVDEAAAVIAEQRACELGEDDTCIDIGLRTADAGDTAAATVLWEASCARGHARGCALVGDVYASGAASTGVDEGKAIVAYAAACAGGLFEACGRAVALRGDAGMDPVELRGLYDVSCEGGLLEACDYLAGMMLDGVGGPADPQAAARLFDRACEAANADSCIHLAWMGRGDGGRAPLRWLERACELDAAACVVLGEVHEKGGIEGADPAAARTAYERACGADRADACHHLGMALASGNGGAVDQPGAARMYLVACDGGHAEACVSLALAHEHGTGVPVDAELAAHYRARACSLGATTHCPSKGTAAAPSATPAKPR